MTTRREVFSIAAGAAAGLCAYGQVPLAFAQVPRREISISGRRVTVVDIHGHCAINEVENVIRGTSLERSISGNRILGPRRLDLMNERGIDIQVLSANQYWWYAANERLARDIIRRARARGSLRRAKTATEPVGRAGRSFSGRISRTRTDLISRRRPTRAA